MSGPRLQPLALATSADYADLPPDDRLLIPALEPYRLRGLPTVWDDTSIRWQDFAAVVIRSCWDYHLRLDEFLDWVSRVERLGVRVINSPALLRWNAHKGYLNDLRHRGVATVPTAWIERGSATSLASVLDEGGWEEAVVKPAVSASATNTWRVRNPPPVSAGEESRFRALVDTSDVMVQPYIREIEQAGEWSLCFFRGEFSHAVVKRPVAGEFRVQEKHGGTSTLATPDAAVVTQAHSVVRVLPHRSCYARVDGCVVNGRFRLMELEALEPSLFLDLHPAAAERFAAAIAADIGVSTLQQPSPPTF